MGESKIQILLKPRVSNVSSTTISSDSDIFVDKTLSQQLVGECVDNIFDSVIKETHIPEVTSDIYFTYENFRKSFQCLTRIELSRSSVLNDPFNKYPFIENPNIEQELWCEEPVRVYDKSGKQLYLDLCKKYEAMPIDRVYKTLHTKELNLKSYGLNMKCVRPITETLIRNKYIRVVNFQNNYLTPDIVAYISVMLCKNSFIDTLILRRCKLGPDGAKNLELGIKETKSLRFLDLSYNELGDNGIKNMENGLKKNDTLVELNLKYNNLGYDAADILGSSLIEFTETLQKLNLSWNYFYLPNACVTLLDNLRYNRTITHLNLSWNSLSLKPLLKTLNRCLTDEGCTWTHLDLSHNKFSGEEEIIILRKILRKNNSLIELDLSGNPISPKDTAFLLTIFNEGIVGKTQLQTLYLKHICINKEDATILKIIPHEKNVVLDRILRNYEIKGPDYGKLCIERIKYLNDAYRKKKKKKGPPDFGTWLFTLPDNPMKKDDFETAVKLAKMKKLDPELITEFMKNFQTPKKRVDILYLREFYLNLYPDTYIPPKPPEEKTETGLEEGKTVTETELVQKEATTETELVQEKATTETELVQEEAITETLLNPPDESPIEKEKKDETETILKSLDENPVEKQKEENAEQTDLPIEE